MLTKILLVTDGSLTTYSKEIIILKINYSEFFFLVGSWVDLTLFHSFLLSRRFVYVLFLSIYSSISVKASFNFPFFFSSTDECYLSVDSNSSVSGCEFLPLESVVLNGSYFSFFSLLVKDERVTVICCHVILHCPWIFLRISFQSGSKLSAINVLRRLLSWENTNIGQRRQILFFALLFVFIRFGL